MVWDLEGLGPGSAGFKFDDFLKLVLSGSPYTNNKTLVANGAAYVDVLVAILPPGAATGDLWYWDNTLGAGVRIPPGAIGSLLQANGVGAAPTYVKPSAVLPYDVIAEQTADVTSVVAGSLVPVNSTSGPISVTPAPSVLRTRFAVVDSRGTAAANNITITFGAALFHGVNQNYVINTSRDFAHFLYIGGSIGWVKVS